MTYFTSDVNTIIIILGIKKLTAMTAGKNKVCLKLKFDKLSVGKCTQSYIFTINK